MAKHFHLDAILRFLLRSPRWIGESPFVGFLFLLCVALFLAGFVFYRYVFIVRNADVGSDIRHVRLDQQKLQQVVQSWNERQEKFNQAESDLVKNIFVKREEGLGETKN